MSFWNNPSASFQGLINNPWKSMQNFGTTGLVPLIPYVAGAVGGVLGGPGGAAAGGALGQEGVDYFGGNKEARTGKGIQKSIFGGAGKGLLASGAYNYGSSGGLDSLFGGGGSETAINPATNLPWSETGSGYAGNGGQIIPTDVSSASSGSGLGSLTSYGSKLANLLKLGNLGSGGSSMSPTAQYPQRMAPIATTKPLIARQPALYPLQEDEPVQDKKELELTALIEALRGKNG
jgi:hypothetical protein